MWPVSKLCGGVFLALGAKRLKKPEAEVGELSPVLPVLERQQLNADTTGAGCKLA